jgi:hypothetical protein
LKSGLHIAHPDTFAGAFFYRTSTRSKLPSDSLTLKGNQSRPASEASENTVKERRPVVAKVVRAFTEPLHFIKTNKEETKALISKNLKNTDPEGLERAHSEAATADPKSFVDMSLVQELEASGFIKQLYKR